MGKGPQVIFSKYYYPAHQHKFKAPATIIAGALFVFLLSGAIPFPLSFDRPAQNSFIATRSFENTNDDDQPIAIPIFNPIQSNMDEPVGCKKPSNNYEIVLQNGFLFNRRTVEMLKYAADLYQGEIDIIGQHITQGSFHDNGSASFGTHLGGGAVDISVFKGGTYTVLDAEIPPLIEALRTAGFAAWLREPGEVYPGSSIHIHAIAIGDEQLSAAAREQLIGESGYFRGYNGLPPTITRRTRDPHNGPMICNWMKDLGYHDLRRPDRSQP